MYASRLIGKYVHNTDFFTVNEAFEAAAKYIPNIVIKFGGDERAADIALGKLEKLERFIQVVSVENLVAREAEARERLAQRDEEDWPYLALAELLGCPVWIEDTDFSEQGSRCGRAIKKSCF